MSYWRDDNDKVDFTPVTFFRPDGDTEDTYVGWCRDNGFFEVGEGIWSGKWYYKYYPEERPKPKTKLHCPVRGCHKAFDNEEKKKDHVLTSMGKAHCTYRKEQKLEQEVEDHRKEMERKHKDEMIKIKKEKRAELLDEIYGDCYIWTDIPAARQKLSNVELDIAVLEGTAVACPVCQRNFSGEYYRDDHIFKSKNEAHRQYQDETWGSELTPAEEDFVDNNTHEQMADENESPSPKILPGQTDIRSFFGKRKA